MQYSTLRKMIKQNMIKIGVFLCVIVCIMLALAMLSHAEWDGTVAENFSGGDGSKDSPFLVGNAPELALVAKLVNSPETHGEYAKLSYKQIADIDLYGVLWDPIGVGSLQSKTRIDIYPFFGVYDGNGFSISGLKLDGAPSVTWTKYTLKTITVNGTTYDMYTEDYKPIYEPKLDSDGLPMIDEKGNPVYKSSQKTSVRSIGLFGYNCGQIKNVTLIEPEVAAGFNKAVAGAISGISVKRMLYRGEYRNGEYLRTTPVTVKDTGVIKNCKVIGGNISLCANPSIGGASGSATGTFNCLGALAGYIESATISNCFSSADIYGTDVTGDTKIGALVGRSETLSTSKSSFTLCTAFSDISVSCVENSLAIHQAGGILGNGDGVISQCCFDGNISLSGGGSNSLIAVGGIVGYNMNTTLDTVFSSGILCASDSSETDNCSVRAGGICGSGSVPENIGAFTLCNVSAQGASASLPGYVCVSASTGNHSSLKSANIYYDTSSIFEINGFPTKCPTGTKSNILFAPDGDLSSAISFSEYFADMKNYDWRYTEDISKNVIFSDSFTSDGTTHILRADGEYLSFDGRNDIILPYGIASVAVDAFDGIDADRVSRIIVPSSVDSTSKALIKSLFPGKTVVLKNSTTDKLFSTIGTELYGDFLVADTGTAKLYVGLDAASTVLPENAQIVSTSGLYNVLTPSSVRVGESFNPAYLSYLGFSSTAEKINLIIPPDTDFADYCEDADVIFSLLGDLGGDEMVSLSDLSAFLKYLQGAYKNVSPDVCDLICDGSVDIRDLHHFLHYFADMGVTLGKED